MRPRDLLLALCAAAVWLPASGFGSGARDSVPSFSAQERRVILSHGPWPAPWNGDRSNRLSRRPEAIAFGAQLFFDPRLSSTGTISCATCHVPERRWTDGLQLAVGLEETDRHTPGLLNVRLNRWFGWDGAGDSLWAQSIRPMLDPREMGMTAEGIAQTVRSDRELACRFRRAFGTAPPPADDDAVLVGAGKALAAFQETLHSGRTPFDEYRDALARGDRKAAARYPVSARRGLKTFVGKGMCSLCHFGPNFTNGEFDEIGIPHVTKTMAIDWGRAQGIKMMLASRFNRLRGHSDDSSGTTARSSLHVELAWRNYGEFKIPSLRNVALTAPYMHNGSVATLRDVVRHYSELDINRLHLGPEIYDSDGAAVDPQIPTMLKPAHLTEQEIDDLVVFLETLSERNATPRRPPAAKPCRP